MKALKESRNEQVLSPVVNEREITAPVNKIGYYTETVEYVGCVKQNGYEDGMFESFKEFAELDNEKWANIKQHSELVEEYHNAMKRLYELCDIKRINVYIGDGCKMENSDKSANNRIVLRATFMCDGVIKTLVDLEWASFNE